MPASKAHVYLHFIWATKNREPSIPVESERDLYRVITTVVRNSGCQLITIGGTPDHVHVLIRLGRTITLGHLMNLVKGASSAFLNGLRGDDETPFRWQPGYGVFSVGANQTERVVAYIDDQKRHHADGTIWPQWEQTADTE